jgi:hypothetical protein
MGHLQVSSRRVRQPRRVGRIDRHMTRSIRLPKIPTRENWSAMLAWIAFAAAMPEVQPLQWSFFNLAIAYAR